MQTEQFDRKQQSVLNTLGRMHHHQHAAPCVLTLSTSWGKYLRAAIPLSAIVHQRRCAGLGMPLSRKHTRWHLASNKCLALTLLQKGTNSGKSPWHPMC